MQNIFSSCHYGQCHCRFMISRHMLIRKTSIIANSNLGQLLLLDNKMKKILLFLQLIAYNIRSCRIELKYFDFFLYYLRYNHIFATTLFQLRLHFLYFTGVECYQWNSLLSFHRSKESIERQLSVISNNL